MAPRTGPICFCLSEASHVHTSQPGPASFGAGGVWRLVNIRCLKEEIGRQAAGIRAKTKIQSISSDRVGARAGRALPNHVPSHWRAPPAVPSALFQPVASAESPLIIRLSAVHQSPAASVMAAVVVGGGRFAC